MRRSDSNWYFSVNIFIFAIPNIKPIEITLEPKKPSEVMDVVRSAIKIDGLTHAGAAKRLGMKTQTLSNILSSKQYLSPKQAARFGRVFGLRSEFLSSGEGEAIAEPYQPENVPEQRLVRNPKQHALTVVNDNQQGDIELMLYWFHEAASRRGDKDGLTLWAEVSRFAQAKSLVANSMRGYRGTDADAEAEYQRRLAEMEEEIIANVEELLDRMGEEQQ